LEVRKFAHGRESEEVGDLALAVRGRLHVLDERLDVALTQRWWLREVQFYGHGLVGRP
jgi:hypothetical protein